MHNKNQCMAKELVDEVSHDDISEEDLFEYDPTLDKSEMSL